VHLHDKGPAEDDEEEQVGRKVLVRQSRIVSSIMAVALSTHEWEGVLQCMAEATSKGVPQPTALLGISDELAKRRGGPEAAWGDMVAALAAHDRGCIAHHFVASLPAASVSDVRRSQLHQIAAQASRTTCLELHGAWTKSTHRRRQLESRNRWPRYWQMGCWCKLATKTQHNFRCGIPSG
jgi:hypothetical protein